MRDHCIRVGGARVHNLQNLSITIPRDRLVVFTGVSGSGKSSLVFDTIFAEGQRKYVESLSAYARQFLNQLQKPDVDFIEGLSPAIAIEQRLSAANPRSTIATTTELYDYFRLVFAHVGQPHCPDSGMAIRHRTTSNIVEGIMALPPRSRVMLLAPVAAREGETPGDVLQRLGREGFVRVRLDGEIRELAGPDTTFSAAGAEADIEAVVDRLVIDDTIRARLSDSVETALQWGQGVVVVLHQEGEGKNGWQENRHSNQLYSPATGKVYARLTPRHFSFNLPQGACEECSGLGQVRRFAMELIVPDPQKSLRSGAVVPWNRLGKRFREDALQEFEELTARFGADADTAFERLPEACRQAVLFGEKRKEGSGYEGVIPRLARLFDDPDTNQTVKRLGGFTRFESCPRCEGRRLRPEILAVRLGEGSGQGEKVGGIDFPGCSIMDVCSLNVSQACRFFSELQLTEAQRKIVGEPVTAIRNRLSFLERVGLEYLSLDRKSGTLSGGEAQRIRLATQLGAGLMGVLYILDEPSIGLHHRDNRRLLETLAHLRDLGNTVLVVEHDEAAIRLADEVVDIGPGAGRLGGKIVAQAPPDRLRDFPESLTGKYLSGTLRVERPVPARVPDSEHSWLEVVGAKEHNLRSIDVRIPLECFVCVTGVSGSGKSTLVNDILKPALAARGTRSERRSANCEALRGGEKIARVVTIDQTPLGRTPRSNPAIYTGAFAHVRELYARLPAARLRGFGPSRFSFNVPGGRCEKCRGGGVIGIDMQFLPSVYVECEACRGKRYNLETLNIFYKGKNIAEVLEMTIEEALVFFRSVPKIREICQTLVEVGLSYVTLGQQATVLSGGEAQRVKIATELSRKVIGSALYVLDEPTTGLHFHDVAELMKVLFRLRDAGHTLVVIEHNLEVIKCADWIIDLGPEGGDRGGTVVAEGPPELLAKTSGSYTGKSLQSVLSAGR